MTLLQLIKTDFQRNEDVKSKFILLIFRLGNFCWCKEGVVFKILYFCIKIVYKIIVEYVLSVELPLNLKVGSGLKIEHGHGLVINNQSTIGDNVSLKHNTTIGCKTDLSNHCIKHAVIGNNVTIHPHSCIIGVSVGSNVIIGAGSVVIKDIDANCIVAGNPAKLIRLIKD